MNDEHGQVPPVSESGGHIPSVTDIDGQGRHTLTTKEAQALFNEKGVVVSERSIVRYCRRYSDGTALLDCMFDESERRHYITPESVENAVHEVRARKEKMSQQFSTTEQQGQPDSKTPAEGGERVAELQKENLDLRITNRGKDFLIEKFETERGSFITRLEASAHRIGELETQLRLEAPEDKRGAEGSTETS